MVSSHAKVPNLKLVMNPEGKLHDWTDLPEDELPELQQIATGGLPPEAAHQMVENLNACKGRGKARVTFSSQARPGRPTQVTSPVVVVKALLSQQQQFQQQQQQFQQQSPSYLSRPAFLQDPSFQSSFRQVFDSRRHVFERIQPIDPPGVNLSDPQSRVGPPQILSRSKTLPNLVGPDPKGDQAAARGTMEDLEAPGNGLVPQAPVRNSTSHRYVEQLRRHKVPVPDLLSCHEVPEDRPSLGSCEYSGGMPQHQPPRTQERPTSQSKMYQDLNRHPDVDDVNWRPLRDYFF